MPTMRNSCGYVFTDPTSYATTMLVLVIDTYGTECCKWSPETLRMEIDDDFQIKIPSPNFDRLMAAITLLTTDSFYQSLPDFIMLCNTLAGDTYDPRQWDPAEAVEIAWGVTEALLIDPPENDDPFSEEITAYIGKALDAEGIITPPDVLQIATRDRDIGAAVSQDFADDPLMFDSIYDLEASKTEEINTAIRGGLQKLAEQLARLPVRNGTTTNAVKNMLRSLGSSED